MKFLLIFLFGILILSSCQIPHYIKGTDFVRNYEKEEQSKLFKPDDVIYFVELDTMNIVFLGKNGPIDKSKPEDIQELQENLDWFDMEEKDDYGYSNPESFFAYEYNKNFKKGLEGVQNKSIHVKPHQWRDIGNFGFKFETRNTILSKQEVRVVIPNDLNKFCNRFNEKYPDAKYAILMGELFVYCGGILTYAISYNARDFKHAATILLPKTIIDLDNKTIIAYDLNQTPILYSIFMTIKSGLKDGFKLEGKRLREKL